ncbi:MAG: hypothetical protein GWN84_00155 [Gammaproteobacteria bacterium]|nr:hypothetical protein [Gammaproteobacteria bacterium]NIR81617.1 hypothetical protein [Gammaproteobacteria bacterium]NIR88168.1 hypothetical protein [Gammaproteobacteria bacterium]NIU02729.1 hypothetical protein [Gammaproteobacteria bacterium]NIV73328.1 hypothetical protein [Gammaproteobacteria bacterium]
MGRVPAIQERRSRQRRGRPLSGHGATVLLAASALLVAGCGSVQPRPDGGEPVQADIAQTEIPEQLLLDVGIGVFDPGELSEEQTEEEGVHSEIREAEGRFIAVHLRRTMQPTGYWGAVRVIPTDTEAVDLYVQGEILRSDGEVLAVRVSAHDATGRQWLEREYEAAVEPDAYLDGVKGRRDAFQDLYNTIANDLVERRRELDADEVLEIRRVAKLRFASSVAPDPFADYLQSSGDGGLQAVRLPAENDPMMGRVLQIRQREYMLIDTLSAYYDNFYDDMWGSYEDWRVHRIKELENQRELGRKSLNRTLLGAAAIVGAIALEVAGVGGSTAGLRNLMILGGAVALKSGYDLGQQAKIHSDAIRELGESFQADVTPMLVEVEGQTMKLTGSAEAQYREWRKLLQQIYLTETGLVGLDPDQPDDDEASAPPPAQPPRIQLER